MLSSSGQSAHTLPNLTKAGLPTAAMPAGFTLVNWRLSTFRRTRNSFVKYRKSSMQDSRTYNVETCRNAFNLRFPLLYVF